MPPTVSPFRLHVLRALYAFMFVGLALVVWPSILRPSADLSLSGSVVHALLGTVGLLALLGIRYPLKLLPLLFFELLWKVVWLVAFALPLVLAGTVTPGASENIAACLVGIVLVPLAVPWRHVIEQYWRAPGDPWRGKRATQELAGVRGSGQVDAS